MAKRLIVIDPGTHSIKAIQVTTSLRGSALTGLYEFPRQREWSVESHSPVSFEEEFRSFMERLPFRADRTVLSLPSEGVIFRNVDLPPGKRKRIEAAAKYALEEEIPFDIEELALQFLYPEPRSDEKTPLIVAAVPKALLARQVDLFSPLGLSLDGIDLDACGLANLSGFLHSVSDRAVAIADMGARKTTVIIVRRNRLQLVRAVPLGGDAVTYAISRHLGIPPEEAERTKKAGGPFPLKGLEFIPPPVEGVFQEFANSLSLFFEAYRMRFANIPVEGLYLTGGASLSAGLSDYLSRVLSLECRSIEPLQCLPHTLRDRHPMPLPQMATSVGLAIGLSGGPKVQRANFRKTGVRKELPFWAEGWRMWTLAGGVLLLILLAFANVFVHLSLKERHLKALKSETRALFQKAFPQVKNIVDEPLQMKQLMEEMKSKGLPAQALAGRTKTVDLLMELNLRIPLSTRMILTELESDREGIRLAGETDSFETIDRVKERLMQSPLFRDFQLLGAKQNPKTRMIEFRIRMGRK